MVSSTSSKASSTVDRRATDDGGAADNNAYVVKPGDYLSKIAEQHGVSLKAILDENPQFQANPDLIHPGDRVKIPAKPAASSPTSAEAPAGETSSSRTRPGGRSVPPPGVDPRGLQAPGEGTSGGLSAVDRVIDKTARVEGGGRYDAFNPNDNGHGVSFGLIQFNQKAGSLPSLMKQMHERNPEKFDQIFGGDAKNMLSESFVRNANLATPDMRAKFRAAGAVPEFQQAQRDLAKSGYFDPAQKAAEKAGIKSERGLAMLFDASVQLGVGGMQQRLNAAVAGGGSERDILSRFAASADNVTGGHNRRRNLLNDPSLSDGPIGSGPSSSGPTLPRADGDNSAARDTGVVMVEPGDSLSSIAAQHGTTWQELYEANKDQIENPNVINAGMSLKLPGSSAATSTDAAAATTTTATTTGSGALSQQVMAKAKEVGDQINATGGYRFDGQNDCWGFVRRTLNPLLAERGLPPLPTADAGTPAGAKNWERVTDWSKVPVGTPLSTDQGHAWGAQWHGGIFAGMRDGVPWIYDNSGAGSAKLRAMPRPDYFKYAHIPSEQVLSSS